MSERNDYWKDFYSRGDADEDGGKNNPGPLDWVKSRFRSGQNLPEALDKEDSEPPYVLRPGEVLMSESELDNEDYDDGLDERDYYPIRFRRDGRTGCLGGIMYAIFVISVSVILACFAWMSASDVLALNKPEHTATISIPKEVLTTKVNEEGKKINAVDIDYVANQLKDSGIIEYKFLFKLYSRISNAAEKIDPGTYELSAQYDYRALVKKMQVGSGSQVGTTITFPEGYTMAQIFEKLEENDICPVEDLYEAAANYNYSYSFLEGMEPGEASRLEGYLFPDTYEFYQGMQASSAINKFLENFHYKLTADMYIQAENLGLSLNEVLAVASMIEKEAANDEERPVIASVIYNRLKAGMLLQIDATVQYALPERKAVLTEADLAIDSPYNTYLYTGLPPGPIANPGMASINAALKPASTQYYYYALDTATGTHKFFRSLAEHEAFVQTQDYSR